MAQQDNQDGGYQAKLLETLQPLLDALVASVNSEHTPEMVKLREIYLRRLVFSGDIIPSRLPPPQNITEVGGYINLLHDLQQPEMAVGALASSLGMAAPLSPQDRRLLEQDADGAIEKTLQSANSWIAACKACHPLWKGSVNQTYGLAQQECTQHDKTKHGGTSTAVVLCL
jgi:hypothetical protein